MVRTAGALFAEAGLFFHLMAPATPAQPPAVAFFWDSFSAFLSRPSQPASIPPRLTLDEAIRTALAQHPRLKRAQEEIVAAGAREKQARSNYFPQINASGFAKQGLSGASGRLGLSGLVTSPLFRDIGASSTVFQNIFDFGRTAHHVKASGWATVSLKHAMEAEQALVILEVYQTYYHALAQQHLLKVAVETLSERELTVRQAAAFHRAGMKSKLDVTLAEEAAEKAQLELAKAQASIKTALAELNHAMGIAGEPAYALEEPKIVVEVPGGLEPLLTESQQQRPDLLALEAQSQMDREIVARAESNRRPRLMALFSGGWVRFSDLTPGRLLLGAFGVDVLTFSGGRLKNEIVEAKANLAQTEAARQGLSQDIRLQVERAHNEWRASATAVRVGEQRVHHAREALRLAQVRYRVELGSFLELTVAETTAANAEAQYEQSLYKYKMAEETLHFAVGRRLKP